MQQHICATISGGPIFMGNYNWNGQLELVDIDQEYVEIIL
jgi:hypothetical protein